MAPSALARTVSHGPDWPQAPAQTEIVVLGEPSVPNASIARCKQSFPPLAIALVQEPSSDDVLLADTRISRALQPARPLVEQLIRPYARSRVPFAMAHRSCSLPKCLAAVLFHPVRAVQQSRLLRMLADNLSTTRHIISSVQDLRRKSTTAVHPDTTGASVFDVVRDEDAQRLGSVDSLVGVFERAVLLATIFRHGVNIDEQVARQALWRYRCNEDLPAHCRARTPWELLQDVALTRCALPLCLASILLRLRWLHSQQRDVITEYQRTLL